MPVSADKYVVRRWRPPVGSVEVSPRQGRGYRTSPGSQLVKNQTTALAGPGDPGNVGSDLVPPRDRI